ncbi:MAG: hypothetical protein Q7T25_02560 [Sideroxyarcus sp.]|nr:hypothetical protein [Sideroxyarcus sp.]
MAERQARYARVKYGTDLEMLNIDVSKYQYQNANISDDQKNAIRAEIGAAISAGKLLETYGNLEYESWLSSDPAVRWKTCEVATLLADAYAFGNFINPEQKNPARGLDIAETGYLKNCGGTAYWRGRIYEEGDALIPGLDKMKLKTNPKSRIEESYNEAIVNSYLPAYERMAELYRLGGPVRYRGKRYSPSFFESNLPYWGADYADPDMRFLIRFQYAKCLQAEPASLVCARGMRAMVSDTRYRDYDKDLIAYYDTYIKNLETLLVNAGLAVPAAN